MAHHETDPEVERLWAEFHSLVNMSSDELRSWLLADAADEEGFLDRPDLGMSPEGRATLEVLGKRKVDLTEDDVKAMRHTVDSIGTLLAARRAVGGPADEQWRHDLMDLGHDPFMDDEG
ncbi:MAG TPA: DUF3140 domain-containing protein [Asanoa sp.]